MSPATNAVHSSVIELQSEADTAALAARLAHAARAGDVIALSGDLGSGKTSFARAFIAALCGGPVEVPSPTFTLVQTYDCFPAPVWHFDLYRLERAEDAFELGIEDAFAEGISLIEWPERLGALLPPESLRLDLTQIGTGEGRRAALTPGPTWPTRLAGPAATGARAEAIRDFLKTHGWGGAQRQPLAGDASFRRYERLRDAAGRRAVLMDAAPPKEDVRPFLRIANVLQAFGYSVPRIEARDEAQGLLLLEDLGDDLFSRVLAERRADEAELYRAACDLLIDLHRQPLPAHLPDYAYEALAAAPDNVVDWYLPALSGQPTSASLRAEFSGLWRAALAPLIDERRVLVLRDYHADNLIWLPERQGLARIGLLDFQDAAAGYPPYDLVSLLQDARRDVSPALEAAMIAHYCAVSGSDPDRFGLLYALAGAARNARILGLWPRLWKRDGKPQYLRFLSRSWGLLERNLAHPALQPLQSWFDREIPRAVRAQPLPGAPI